MTGTVLYPWLFSVPWFPTDSRHHSCDTGGPRHRRRQRTLECGPAGPAQQHGTSVPSSSGRTSTRHRSLSSRYAKFPHAENGASPPKRKRSIPSCSLFLVSQSKGLRSRRIWRRRPRCLRPCPASGAEIASLLRMGGDLPPPLRRQPRADGPIPLTPCTFALPI